MRVERLCFCWGALLLLGLTGCRQAPELPTVLSPYKIDIQQGNIITQEMIAKLKAGMTRSQVRFVLGSPLVIDPFRGDRWDYVSLYQKQGKDVERRRVTVIFDDDKLVRIEGDVALSDTVSAPEPPKPATPEKPAAKPEAAAATLSPAGKPAAPQPAAAKPASVVPSAAAPGTATATSAPASTGSPAAAPGATPAPAAAADAPAEAKAGAIQKPADGKKTADDNKSAEDKKSEAARKDAPKEKPKPGFFGRMLDKLGI